MVVCPAPSNRERARGVCSVTLDLRASKPLVDSVYSCCLAALYLLYGLGGLFERGWIVQLCFYWLLRNAENYRVFDGPICVE